jgi:large subunit ribosomal protein L32e
MIKDDVLNDFTSIKGVGKAKAELLYKNGYVSFNALKSASIEDLTKIKGIPEKLANDIIKQLKEKEVTPIKEEKKSEKTVESKKVEVDTEKSIEEEKKIETIKEVEEKKYKVKKKPKLSKDLQNCLAVRKKIKNRTPNFLREEWFRYKRIKKNWRRPDGISSKMRINLKYRPSRVRVGFRGPKETRGLHPSGFEEILVYNTADIEKLDPKTQAARIGSTVGTKKRIEIEKKADDLDVRILNRGK